MIQHYIRSTSDFDSHLYTDDMRHNRNARFQLWLRVFLKQGPTGSTAAPGGKSSLAFANKEWDKLKATFKSKAQKFWTGQYWLVPNVEYPELQFGPNAKVPKKYQCNAYCELCIDQVDSAADAHRVVNLYKVPSSDEASFPTDSANMSKGDMNERRKFNSTHGGTCTQDTLPHEVGHLLGLNHIGTYVSTTFTDSSGVTQMCTAANQNTQPGNVCYMGSTKQEDCSVMGIGSGLSSVEGRIWHDRISQHTGIARTSWTLSRRKVFPRQLP